MSDSKTTAQPKGSPVPADQPVTAGPVTPIALPQTLVEPDKLLVSDLEPVVGEDGKVYVSDAVSDAAVAAGYAPDIQPKAHPAQNLPRLTDAELAAQADERAKNVAALEAIQAPLSVKVEQVAAGNDASDVVANLDTKA